MTSSRKPNFQKKPVLKVGISQLYFFAFLNFAHNFFLIIVAGTVVESPWAQLKVEINGLRGVKVYLVSNDNNKKLL